MAVETSLLIFFLSLHSRNYLMNSTLVLGAGIEIFFRSWNWRTDSLIFLPQLPPMAIVLGRRNGSFEDAPAPPVNDVSERKEGHFLQCHRK